MLSNPICTRGSGTSWNLAALVRVPASSHKAYLLIALPEMVVLQYRAPGWSVCAAPPDTVLGCFPSSQRWGVPDRGTQHQRAAYHLRWVHAPKTGVLGGGGTWRSERKELAGTAQGSFLLLSLKWMLVLFKEKKQTLNNSKKSLHPHPLLHPWGVSALHPSTGRPGLQLQERRQGEGGGLSAKGKAGMPVGSPVSKENVKDACHLKWRYYYSRRCICCYSACVWGTGVGTGTVSVLCHPRHFLMCKCHYWLKAKSKLSIELMPSGSSNRKVW